MNNFTANCYEMKREIANLSKKFLKGVSKPTYKFLTDMLYGLAKNGSCLISETARALDEDIKVINIIERLCDNLVYFNAEKKEIIWNNYINHITKHVDKSNPIALFDDSDYSRKLEDDVDL